MKHSVTPNHLEILDNMIETTQSGAPFASDPIQYQRLIEETGLDELKVKILKSFTTEAQQLVDSRFDFHTLLKLAKSQTANARKKSKSRHLSPRSP
jgi:hypothetical protein